MITLAVPVVLSELGWMAQGVVDNIMVGKLGPAAIEYSSARERGLLHAIIVWNRPAARARLRWFRKHMAGRTTTIAIAGWRKAFTSHASSSAAHGDPRGSEIRFTRFGVIPEVAVLSGGYLRILNWGLCAPALRWHAPLLACRGVGGARYHGDICIGQPAQLVWELGVDLRQIWNASTRRERFRHLYLRIARCHGRCAPGFCMAV